MSTPAGPPDVLPAAIVRDLLARSTAIPLLPDTWPVPVLHDGRWWHQPAAAGAPAPDPGEVDRPGARGDVPPEPGFVPAPAALAARYDELATRRHRAHHAARSTPAADVEPGTGRGVTSGDPEMGSR